MIIVCPECGSTRSRRRSGTERVCRDCGAWFTPPSSLWERLIVALVFLVPSLVFGVVAVFFLLLGLNAPANQKGMAAITLGCSTVTGLLALLCLFGANRELIRRGATPSNKADSYSPTPQLPLEKRLISALVLLVLSLVFAILGVGILFIALDNDVLNVRPTLFGYSGVAGLISLICFVLAIREVIGHGNSSPEDRVGGPLDEPQKIELPEVLPSPPLVPQEDESQRTKLPEVLPCPPPLVPQEEAEELLREIAEKHGAKRILQTLGHLPQKHLDNAAACFAQRMGDDETPLALIDTAFLRNGKAGFLLTNRGLYSSFCPYPFWLADIDEVSYATPEFNQHLFSYLVTAGILVSAYLGGMLGSGFGVLLSQFGLPPRPFSLGWSAISISLSVYLPLYYFLGGRQLQRRLLVNGKTVCLGKHLHGDFWVELLTELAEAARHIQFTGGDRKRKPRLVILETALRDREIEADELRQIRNPSWHDLEWSIRALDQESHPSLCIWAGEVEKAPALEILGGNGKYVLRERGDAWIYYDPSAGEEEIEVCKDPSGHRAPAFYVCTDLRRVLEIARHYIETGTPE